MPAQNHELAGDRDGRHLMAFPCADPDEEGMQGPRRLRRRPGRFDEHRPGMAAADLADPAMLGEAEPRLPNTWIEPDLADKLLRRWKTADVADCREEPCRHGDVYPSDGQEPLDSTITESAFRHLAIKRSSNSRSSPSRSSSRTCRSVAIVSSSGNGWRFSHVVPI
jgi:hypothetical protein